MVASALRTCILRIFNKWIILKITSSMGFKSKFINSTEMDKLHSYTLNRDRSLGSVFKHSHFPILLFSDYRCEKSLLTKMT